MIFQYPIGKVKTWTSDDVAPWAPKPYRYKGEIQVSLLVDGDVGVFQISFGSPYDYNLSNMLKSTLRRLLEKPEENFYIDMGQKLFILNQDMQDWLIKASGVAAAIDMGN